MRQIAADPSRDLRYPGREPDERRPAARAASRHPSESETPGLRSKSRTPRSKSRRPRSKSRGPRGSPSGPRNPRDAPGGLDDGGSSLQDDPRRPASDLARLVEERNQFRDGLDRLTEERSQLRAELARLDEQSQRDGRVLEDYRAVKAQLEQRCKDLKLAGDKAYHAEQLAGQELARLRQELVRRQQEGAQLRLALKEVDQLNNEVARLRRAEEMLGKLQKEVLAGVDRHEPAFDEAVLGAFVAVNGKINALVKYTGAFFKIVGAVPFDTWGPGAMWAGAYNTEVAAVQGKDRRAVKQLLRLVVWHFVGRTLLDRARPFACFGSVLARNLDRDYHSMFEDVATSDAAAKWRAMTAARLLELDDEPCRASIQDFLLAEFAKIMHEHMGHAATPLKELEEWLRSSVFKQLGPVLQSAVALAQLVAKERSGFSLEMPDLTAVGFAKADNDAQMTTRGAPLNIDLGGANDEEGGVVVLVAAPMLIKWGTASGHGQPGSGDVLAKAFVEVVPGTKLPARPGN
ncbi:hypothetical protein C8A05DRAFT_36568 [Staphylotrichum tortipilum]|uniref:Uncharacterized protein n=1 Tax=Staphylotrichum tortipilum TaxID=2831512 RepID=A0AAN6MFB3_9PEZI|nr:hypothetical protein C8A05DRAFT_36568 [Staphylotrichum longicolle]